MEIDILRDETRGKLFFLINKGIGKFNSLKKELGLRSNELTYHLKKLASSGLIEKTESGYALTEEGKDMFPFRKIVTKKEIPAMAVTATAIIKNGKVFLRIKDNEPMKGSLILFGGTIRRGEDVFTSATRKAKEQCNSDIKNLKLRGISDTTYTGKGKMKQHWLVYVFTAEPVNEPSDGKWHSLKKLPYNIFLDDYYFLKHLIYNKKLKYYQMTYDESQGSRGKMKVIRISQ